MVMEFEKWRGGVEAGVSLAEGRDEEAHAAWVWVCRTWHGLIK